MVEARLRLRRQLALCLLLALWGELNSSLEHQLANLAAATRELAGARPAWRRPARVRLASAWQLQMAPTEQWEQVYQHHTSDESNFVSRLLQKIQHHLPAIELDLNLFGGRERFPADSLDAQIDEYYAARFAPNTSLDDLQLLSVKASVRVAPIPLATSFGYETRELLRQGSLPALSDRLCSLQLAHLAKRLETALQRRGEASLGASATASMDNLEASQIYETRDIELMRYLDTFGRVPSDVLRGNTKWYGAYDSCLATQLRPLAHKAPPTRAAVEGDRQAIKFRYCLGAIRSTGWQASAGAELERRQVAANRSRWTDYGASTSDINLNNFFIHLGLCLPEACDSSALERLPDSTALERLAKFNLAKPFNSDHYKLTDLYCLPDERSPLRRIPPLGRLLLAAAFLWLCLIGAATSVHLSVEAFYANTVEQIRAQRDRKLLKMLHREVTGAGLLAPPRLEGADAGANEQSGGAEREEGDEDKQEAGDEQKESAENKPLNLRLNWIKLCMFLQEAGRRLVPGVDLVDCLSLRANWLRYTRRFRQAIVDSEERQRRRQQRRLKNERLLLAPTSDEWEPDDSSAGAQAEAGGQQRQRRVDTTAMNALKVIALVWVMAGHTIYYLASILNNTALLAAYLPTLVSFAVIQGAMYITELFFVITGCLSCYLTFKHNTSAPAYADAQSSRPVSLMSGRLFSAPYWALMVLGRYLRILPTYLLIYSFVKLVNVYTGGSGQLWDYAVSSNSLRRHCVQESWWPVLTLTSNYVEVYKHCIVGGWYLSVDMQFALLATPLLILLAHAQRRPEAASGGADEPRIPLRKLGDKMKKPASLLEIDGRPPSEKKQQEKQTGGGEKEAPGRLVAKCGRRVWQAHGLLWALVLASGLLSIGWALLTSPVDLSYLQRFSPHGMAVLSQNISMYTNALFRFRAFATGLLAGHLLYLYEFRLIKLPKLVQLHGSKLALLLFSLAFGTMFLPVLYPRGKLRLSHEATMFAGVGTAAWVDLLGAVLIFLLCIGKAPKPAIFLLRAPFWSLLSSLSLGAFLIHAELIIMLATQLNPPPATSYSGPFLVFSATVVLTYALALATHLAFELPVSRLLEAVLRGGPNSPGAQLKWAGAGRGAADGNK